MSTADIPRHVPAMPASLPRTGQSAHSVQFYSEDEYLLSSVSKMIGVSLKKGEGAVVIATKSHRAGIAQKIIENGVDLAQAAQSGRYLALDAEETLSQLMAFDTPGEQGLPDPDKFHQIITKALETASMASLSESPRVCAFGEMVALLWGWGNRMAAIRLEHLWNELGETHAFSLLCAYPMVGFDRDEYREAFLEICAAHSCVIPAETHVSLPNEDERNRNIIRLQQKAMVLETERAERRQIEKTLRLRESELADVLENALEGIQLLGPDQRVVWVNSAALQLLGYTREEYTGHAVHEFYVERQIFEEYWRKMMLGQDVYDFSADLRCKDGSVKTVLMHSNGLWENGRFIHTRCFLRDITEHKRMEQALLQSKAELELLVEQRTEALRRLSAQVLALQDSERRRVARELHDSLGQYLVGLKLNVDMLRQSPARADLWAQSERLLERCISEVRSLSHLLHPPMMEEAGFIPAARWYVEGFGQRCGLKIIWQGTWNDSSWRLPAPIELALFRILQEAMTNVHRHSGASIVTLRLLRQAESVVLEIEDDGCGISQRQLDQFNQSGLGMGVGLSAMRERVRELHGALELASQFRGTRARVVLPLTGATVHP